MTKKKLDPRIRTLIENGVQQRHRSFFVLVGDHGKDQVANLHYILSKSQVAKRPNVLWCYKKDLGFSSHRQKRMKQMKKMKQLGIAGQDANKEEDPFELFLTSTDISYTYYSETDRILGQTFGMCVLQDFEALTPNLLARTIETVQGGGVVVLLLKTLSSLKQLYTMVMDVHSRYRTENKHEAVARFNERFLLSLSTCESCLVLDDELNILPISSASRDITPLPSSTETKTAEELALENLKAELCEAAQDVAGKMKSQLVSLAKTMDQASVVQSFTQVLADHKNSLKTTVSLTAGRGRGKSAALGLALAGAVANGYGNIFVTAPSPENLKTVFEFLFKGLDALGYQEHLDYDIIQSTHAEFNKAVVRVNVFKADHRQTIMYVQPQDAHLVSQAELVMIDEAAAIPLPLVQALSTGSHLVFMASTINGYEGTGRSLSLKLIQQLRSQSTNMKEGLPMAGGDRVSNVRLLKEFQLSEPIRYAANDPVERWLNNLLCLDAANIPSHKASKNAMPHPDKCELYAVNRDTLFSFHKASEIFLQRMMSLFVASHYKNTPNDLQLLSDAPAHKLYVLLAPVDEAQANSLPDILAAIQVCHEGHISKQVIMNSLARGKRAGGDLIPWTISQQFQDDDFASLSGARIVRVAVHPDLQGMGYGSRAMRQLEKFYKGELFDQTAEDVDMADSDDEDGRAAVAADAADALHTETLKPRANLKPLLVKLNEKKPTLLHWLGTSFGLTPSLFKFWKRLGMLPVYLRQTTNDITGEHTMIMMKTLCEDAQVVQCSADWLLAFYEDFRKRFVNLLGFQFRSFTPSLCLDILEQQTGVAKVYAYPNPVSAYDLKRLESYANNMVDYHMIMDLVPGLAREYFLTQPAANRPFSLSPVQAAILLSLGLQQRIIEDLEKELKLPVSQLLAMFIKGIRKFASHYRDAKIRSIEAAEATPEAACEPAVGAGQKRALDDAEAWEPTEQNLDEDLEEAADEVTKRMRAKQRELINSLDLDRFKIGGTDEEWNKELQKKKKNLGGAIMNISGAPKEKTGHKSAAKEVMAEAHKMSKKSGKKILRR